MTLADLRQAVALTQDELAKACGVTKTTVSAWERGTAVPRLKHERALAEALHASIAEVKHVIQSQQVRIDQGEKLRATTRARGSRRASAGDSIATPAQSA